MFLEHIGVRLEYISRIWPKVRIFFVTLWPRIKIVLALRPMVETFFNNLA